MVDRLFPRIQTKSNDPIVLLLTRLMNPFDSLRRHRPHKSDKIFFFHPELLDQRKRASQVAFNRNRTHAAIWRRIVNTFPRSILIVDVDDANRERWIVIEQLQKPWDLIFGDHVAARRVFC